MGVFKCAHVFSGAWCGRDKKIISKYHWRLDLTGQIEGGVSQKKGVCALTD